MALHVRQEGGRSREDPGGAHHRPLRHKRVERRERDDADGAPLHMGRRGQRTLHRVGGQRDGGRFGREAQDGPQDYLRGRGERKRAVRRQRGRDGHAIVVGAGAELPGGAPAWQHLPRDHGRSPAAEWGGAWRLVDSLDGFAWLRTDSGRSDNFTAAQFLAAHPVGCIFEWNKAINPGAVYGGTWRKTPSIGAHTFERTE